MDGENTVVQDIVTPEQLDVVLQAHKENSQPKLGASLLQENIITQRQLNVALQKQLQDRNVPIGQILIGMGAVSEEIIKRVLSKRFGIPGLKLRKFQIDPEVIKMVPSSLASKLRAIPLYRIENHIIIAMEDPVSREGLHDLELCVRLKVDPILASSEDINFLIRRYYGVSPVNNENLFVKKIETTDESRQSFEDPSKEYNIYVVQLIEKIIADAISQEVNEVHIEPDSLAMSAQVRFRRYGKMLPHSEVSADIQKMVVQQIKTMAGLNPQEIHNAQEGKLRIDAGEAHGRELRATVIPTHNGLEDVVIHILAKPRVIDLEELNMPSPVFDGAIQALKYTQGLLLVCGPKLSGKTTTLHSLLHRVNTSEHKIWTAERQIQILQSGLRQIEVNPATGWTFAKAIASTLSGGADILMVDEIKDASAANAALEASFSGALVIASIHAGSAIEGISKFLDFGVDAFHFSNAMLGAIGQRLIPKLCAKCVRSHVLSMEEQDVLAADYCRGSSVDPRSVISHWQSEFGNENGDLMLYASAGCENCGDTGYKGLIGIYEWVSPSAEFKKNVRMNAQTQSLSEMVLMSGMRTMRHDGVEKALRGFIGLKQLQMALFKTN